MKRIVSIVLCLIMLVSASCMVFAANPPMVLWTEYGLKSSGATKYTHVGDTVNFSMDWFPEYQNEGYDIVIKDLTGKIILSDSNTFPNYSQMMVTKTYKWDTKGVPAGEYKVEVLPKFYSFNRWNENPSTLRLNVILVEDCEKHTWNEGEIIQEASFAKPGLIMHKCEVCGLESTDEIPAKFTDVVSTEWYVDAIEWAATNKITSGTSETTFAPKATLTIAQMVQFLYNSAGAPKVETKGTEWYSSAQTWGIEKGYITEETNVNLPCSRYQVVYMMYSAQGSPSVDGENPFVDASGDAILWAYQKGITSGDGHENFKPDATVTRAEAVQFLYNAQKK